MIESLGSKYNMSAERRLPKGLRKSRRERKARLRQEIGVTKPHPDSFNWPVIESLLRDVIPNYEKSFARHSPILREFSEIRQKVKVGEPLALVSEFHKKYKEKDPNLLLRLGPALSEITKLINSRR